MAGNAKDAIVVEMQPEEAAAARQATNPETSDPANAASILRSIPEGKQLKLQFDNLSAWVPLTNSNGGAKEKQVLFSISGSVEPGEMMGLMGPSGSGKSTLLAVLSGRTKLRHNGDILFGGQQADKGIKRKLGFVTQDDVLFSELTVYETLYYAARLRLPRSMTIAQKCERVETVLKGLGLSKVREQRIGSVYERGVSGGERKRVSIGHELLVNPSVLFMDEPTSGLDSTTALKLMSTARGLAKGGRVVVMSIHQPSSRLFFQMDKLFLLAEGKTVFYGSLQAAAGWLGSLGLYVPFGINMADFILDLANNDFQPEWYRGEEPRMKTIEEVVEAFAQRKIGLGKGGVLLSDLDEEVVIKTNATGQKSRGSLEVVVVAEDGSASSAAGADEDDPVEKAVGGDDSKWGASWLEQTQVLTIRSIKIRQESSLSLHKLVQILVPAVFAGLFWWQVCRPVTYDSLFDTSGLLFFEILYMGFVSLYAAIFTFPMEFNMLVKERQSGMYQLSAYYISRSVADIPMDLLIPTGFVIIVYFMGGLRLEAWAFFCNLFTVLLISLTGQSIGLLIGANFSRIKDAQMITTVFVLFCMLVGGFYVTNVPGWIAWAKYISYLSYGYDLALKIQFRNQEFDCVQAAGGEGNAPLVSTLPDGLCTVAQSGYFKNTNVDGSVGQDVGALFAIFIGVRILIYLCLKWKTSS